MTDSKRLSYTGPALCAIDEITPHDGQSFYRALARLLVGDPTEACRVKAAVQEDFLWKWSNENHPQHQQYHALEEEFYDSNGRRLFAALECPDVMPDRIVAFVVAHALDIRMAIWTKFDECSGKPSGAIWADGTVDFPTYHLLLSIGQDGLAAFSSLVRDDSDRQLRQYLAGIKSKGPLDGIQGLELMEAEYYWDESLQKYRRKSPSELDLHDQSAGPVCSIYVLSVMEPEHIQPAISLLNESLKRAPAQCVPVSDTTDASYNKKKPLKWYVSCDCEFDDYPTTAGQSVQLVTVWTVGLDRILAINFNLADMLLDAKANTVPEIEGLIQRVYFNPNLLKVWWNLQCDMSVMDDTIMNMYQGGNTAVKPPWILSSQYFQGDRPPNTMHSGRAMDCSMHIGIPKPCYGHRDNLCYCRYGHIDLSNLLDFFSRQLRFKGAREKRDWTRPIAWMRYEHLVENCLSHDPIYPFLRWAKQLPMKYPKNLRMSCFYSRLHRGFEEDEDLLAYVLGDVIGLGLIMRNLATTRNRGLVFGMLAKHSNHSSEGDLGVPQHDWRHDSTLR